MNMKSNKIIKKPVKELVMLNLKKIVFTNNRLSISKLDYLKNNFDMKKLEPVSVFCKDGKFVLTDGNHRCKTLLDRGELLVPAFFLTQKEYDFVAYSKNKIDVLVNVPEMVKVYY